MALDLTQLKAQISQSKSLLDSVLTSITNSTKLRVVEFSVTVVNSSVILQATTENTPKPIEFRHPISKEYVLGTLVKNTTNTYQVILTDLPIGSYSQFICRLRNGTDVVATNSTIITTAQDSLIITNFTAKNN